eukprot:9487684-Pyramimonas_sp.AAC.1
MGPPCAPQIQYPKGPPRLGTPCAGRSSQDTPSPFTLRFKTPLKFNQELGPRDDETVSGET